MHRIPTLPAAAAAVASGGGAAAAAAAPDSVSFCAWLLLLVVVDFQMQNPGKHPRDVGTIMATLAKRAIQEPHKPHLTSLLCGCLRRARLL